ncbi:MAG: MFS transporter [Streptococcus sp.]|nr:MFS transporter [Streptococcus sp.]
MNLFFKNHLYRFLTISNFLNKLGASIYNIVFIVFAASMNSSKLAVAVANIVVLLPVLVSVFVGMQADQTKEKRKWLISLGYLQALLFVVVAYLSDSRSWLVFSIVCFINVMSDIITDFRSGLEMPIFQKNIVEDDLMEAYSFNQFISYICSLGGQALGVWLLSQTNNNFSLVALLNALSFLLSSLFLWKVRKELTHNPVTVNKVKKSLLYQLKELYQNLQLIFKESENTDFGQMLFTILLVNGLGSALESLYHLYFLETPFFHLSFSQSIFLLQAIFVVFAVIGSLTPKDYFAKQSLSYILLIDSLLIVVVSLVNFFHLPQIISLFCLTFIAYLGGKVSPKINSMLMSNISSDVLAQTSNFLGLLFMLAMPLGSVLFTSLGLWNIGFAWFVYSVLAGIAVYFSIYQNRSK